MLLQLGSLFSGAEGSEAASGFGWEQIIALGLVILIMALMPRIIKTLRRERKSMTAEQIKSLRSGPNIKNKADEILVELAEMSREINAQVDTKIRVLNKLIRDAEKVVKRYEELSARQEQGKLEPERKELSAGSEPPAKRDQAEIVLPVADAEKDKDGAEEAESESAVAASGAATDNTSVTGVWQRSIGEKIIELDAKGYDINEIARKTRMSVSEVSLMLEMYRKR